MTVSITQEEMNILNLNGCKTEWIADDVRFRRASGESDEDIRKSYDNLLNELRPITKISPDDTGNIQTWNDKGGITPYEYGKRTQMEFDGTYQNIDNSANLSKFEQMLKDSPRNKTVAERIEQNKLKKEEREKRIKEGSASFFDKIGSALDDFGNRINEYENKTTNLPDDDKDKNSDVEELQKIKFDEALANSYLEGSWIPFVGGYIDKADDKKQREIQEHILHGEPIRQDELNFLNQRVKKKQEEAVRGYTIGGAIAKDFLPSLIRFGSEIAAGGWVLKSLGLTGAGTKTGVGAYNALRSANASKKVALTGGKVARGLTNMTVAGAVNTALPTTYNDTYANYQERRLEKSFELTPDGRVYFKECDEKPAVTFMKSLGLTLVMFASEHAGELIGMPVKGVTSATQKYITSPISEYLKSNNTLKAFVNKAIPQLSKEYEKLNNMPIRGKSLDWLKDKVKYDGFIEELGEEVVEDILNITLGTGDEERTFENYIKAIKKSPDEWAILAGAVALQGGTLSVASHLLGNYMEKHGASDDVIIDTLNGLKDDGIKTQINKLIQSGEINVDNFNLPADQKEARKKEVEEQVYNKLLKGNVNKNIALANAQIAGQFFGNFSNNEKSNKVLNNLLKSLEVRYNIPADQNEMVLNQAAMYKSPKETFDEFFDQVQKEKNPKQKAYFRYTTNDGVELDIFHDIVRHDDKRHSLTKEQWKELFDVIDNNIEEKMYASQSYYKGTPILLKIKSSDNYFGVSMEVFPNRVMISTAVKDTNNAVDAWIEREKIRAAKTTAPNHRSRSSTTKSGNVILGQTLNDIITHVKGQLNPNVNNHEDRNLVMAHASKSANIDNIIESGSLIAPSFSITARESETLEEGKFGDILFIRNPEKINYQSDNIYDRDIYSPRMPMPHYDIPDGRIVDYYEYDSLKRSYENNPERFVEKWGESFDEMFKGAKKVLFLGFTPSGNRRYVPYTNENILKEMSRHGVVNKEGMDYGLSSLLARFSNKQTSKQQLKDAAKNGLGSGKDLNQKWEDIKKEYDDLGDKVAEYYYDKYSFYEVQSDAFYYIAKNKMSALKKEFDMKDIPADLIKEVKDFVEKASTLPRSYFEAKPMREVSLSEFNHALVKKGTLTDEQIKGLNNYGVKVTEYEKGELNKVIENLDKNDNKIFFQSAKKFNVESHIENIFGDSVENVTEGIKADIQNLLEENDISPEEFNIDDIKIYGSYSTGKNNETSDIDFLVEYSGTMREDDAFNMFADAALKLTDKNGKEIDVDINPIRQDKSGTIDEFLERNKDYKKPTTLFQSAYHGSPHKFDKFSNEHIGTGEGYQAHGYGLYFAGNKDVSEDYRKTLSSTILTYKGKTIPKEKESLFESLHENGKKFILDIVQYRIDEAKNIIEEIEKDRKYFGKNYKKDDYKNYQRQLKQFEKEYKEIQNIDEKQIEYKKGGQLYEVDIPENDVLLDEDKKFSEQSEKVQEAINKIANDYVPKYFLNNLQDAIDSNKTGKAIYNAIKSEITSLNPEQINGNESEATSKLLNKYGIKGITYDGKQDGRCYVVFDDKAIKILNTYYQESGNDYDDMLIAGYTPNEVMNKLSTMWEQQADSEEAGDEKTLNEITAKIHVLEDALESLTNPIEDERKLQDLYINVYYIMNDQELPAEYLEFDKNTNRTIKELIELHNERKEKQEAEYYGYFKETDDKNIITIMQSANASTALHELGHFYLKALNELAEVDEKARRMLDEVNKKLGAVNGVYTEAQQEKFARSFEAYLYNGKAPNNTLRQVFENFREWLKTVYRHVTDIEGADISEEMQQLFDKIFGNDEYYEEKKQAKELLDKVKKAAKKEKVKKVEIYDDSKLDETQKRHKEISYDILSSATGKSKKYLKSIFETASEKKSIIKKREQIEELIAHVDDKISSANGFLPEWSEFYSDTGVSYENNEGGDYKLAEQALDVILNKRYKKNSQEEYINKLEEEAEYYEREINNANRQYKILISSFKNENRNVALSAFYEWINSLPEQIKEDYENKFTYDVALIERNENIDKFDKAKRNIISAALEIDNQYNINSSEKYKQTVLNIMKNLDFLQPADKAKMTTNILDTGSVSMLMSQIDSILDIAKTMEDVNYRRKLEREIHKELQGTKNVRKNGRTVGKYNYKSNKLFEELRELDRLSPEMANEYRLENKKFADAEDNGLSYKDRLINKFLSYKAGGRTFADTELMKNLYDEITKIKLAGKAAKSEQDLQEKLSAEKDIDELIEIVQKKKNAKITTKAYINMFGNLESIINALFNKDIKERYATEILYDETQSQAWQYEQKKNFEEAVAKIYNLPKWAWDNKIIAYLNEKHTYSEYRRKYDKEGNIIKTRNINRTLTKMDIIQAYIWSKNDILEKRLINQFGEDQLYSMFDEMSLADVQFAELMMRTAQSYYPMVNKAFIEKYGLDLPKVSCYFPSTPERGSEVDLYNDYSSKSLGNGFTKSRASSEILPMDFHNPVATLYNHIDGVAKFAFMSKNLDEANIRFRNTDLKRAIIDKYGEDAYRSLEQSLMNITYKKEAPVFNGYQKVLDNLTGNWIQANVAIKPIVGLKQLLSANNYAVDMPYMQWQLGFFNALAHPKKTIDYMMKIPYLKARYGGNFSNEFLKQTVENSAFAQSKKLKDLCNVFIKTGDIGAIIFGGKPYIDYMIKDKGMSEAEAIKQFIISTNRSQQSSAISSLSNFQVSATRNPIGKLFIAYKNSPQQYIRMCGDAIISATNGDITKAQAAKLLFQYGYLQPFLYAAATSGSLLRLLFTGDDDDLLKDLKLSIFNLGSDAAPILGDIYKYAINRLVFKDKYVATTTPLLGDIENEIGKISKDDVSAKDFFEAIFYMFVHAGAGYNTKAIENEMSGVGDIVNGDIEKGSMKVLGYTNKRAERITKK